MAPDVVGSVWIFLSFGSPLVPAGASWIRQNGRWSPDSGEGEHLRRRQREPANFARAAARIGPRLETDPEDFRALCGLVRCLVHLERFAEASALLARVSDHSDPMNYHLACTFARAGETSRALDTLEQVVDHGWDHRQWLDRDPDFDGLRDHRRFIRIANSIGRS